MVKINMFSFREESAATRSKETPRLSFPSEAAGKKIL